MMRPAPLFPLLLGAALAADANFTPAQAQLPCGDAAALTRTLRDELAQRPVAAARLPGGVSIETFVNKAPGVWTWTVAIFDGRGAACVLAHGRTHAPPRRKPKGEPT